MIDDNPLWKGLNNLENIRSLAIEADKVVVRSKLSLPRTDLTIKAINLVFESGGSIDVSPRSFFVQPAACLSSSCHANDGADGEPGGNITILAENISFPPDPTVGPRLIANGGRGQNAGAGFGDTSKTMSSDMRTVEERMLDLGSGYVYKHLIVPDSFSPPHGPSHCTARSGDYGVKRWGLGMAKTLCQAAIQPQVVLGDKSTSQLTLLNLRVRPILR